MIHHHRIHVSIMSAWFTCNHSVIQLNNKVCELTLCVLHVICVWPAYELHMIWFVYELRLICVRTTCDLRTNYVWSAYVLRVICVRTMCDLCINELCVICERFAKALLFYAHKTTLYDQSDSFKKKLYKRSWNRSHEKWCMYMCMSVSPSLTYNLSTICGT